MNCLLVTLCNKETSIFEIRKKEGKNYIPVFLNFKRKKKECSSAFINNILLIKSDIHNTELLV